MNDPGPICGLVLAAGLSVRMGKPKMILPWGHSTVIRTVVSVLDKAGLDEIYVITGSNRDRVEQALSGTSIQTIFNPSFPDGEMIHSIQAGLVALPSNYQAVLVALGDQPFIELRTVHLVLNRATTHPTQIIIPSYRKRRGHPWILPRLYWNQVLALRPPATLRDFFQATEENIQYVVVNTASVIQDLDTPEDYERANQIKEPPQ